MGTPVRDRTALAEPHATGPFATPFSQELRQGNVKVCDLDVKSDVDVLGGRR
jgi:hypothetical protein